MLPELSVVVLNYRTPKLVLDCLHSLAPQVDGLKRRVIVVDNASGDDSAERIDAGIHAAGFQGWAKLVRSPRNGGFADGNNFGVAAQPASFYLLLNSDTLVRAGALDCLMSTAAADQRLGVVAPRLEWPDGQAQISCFRSHSPTSEFIDAAHTGPITRFLGRYDVPLPVSDAPLSPDWVSFACVLIRAEVMEKLGGVDAGFFMYFEDADFCLRTRKAGWRVYYQPAARIVHLRGGSGDVKSSLEQRRRPPSYLYASRNRFFRKHYGTWGPLRANLAWQAGRFISLTREALGQPAVAARAGQWRDNWIDTFARLDAPDENRP